jgi:hypothetical protein
MLCVRGAGRAPSSRSCRTALSRAAKMPSPSLPPPSRQRSRQRTSTASHTSGSTYVRRPTLTLTLTLTPSLWAERTSTASLTAHDKAHKTQRPFVIVASCRVTVISSRAQCWAYRHQPPWQAYDHTHFVRTLATVMSQTDLVIWLPRSRAGVPGQYQERCVCCHQAHAHAAMSHCG